MLSLNCIWICKGKMSYSNFSIKNDGNLQFRGCVVSLQSNIVIISFQGYLPYHTQLNLLTGLLYLFIEWLLHIVLTVTLLNPGLVEKTKKKQKRWKKKCTGHGVGWMQLINLLLPVILSPNYIYIYISSREG